MVEEIYTLKNEILQQAKKELKERGPERIDVARMGELVDMVKDLAEAEEKCWKAQYYRNAVTEAMENKYGYPQGTTQMGGSQGVTARQGYGMQSARPGYSMMPMGHEDVIGELEDKYQKLPQEEKMMFKNQVLSRLK